jgi:hypothetical protein
MAYLGVDPWRWQYFAPVPCPAGIDIPVDEASAWELLPAWRHIHNKLYIAASQGLPHGPHGTLPPRYPVFSKPIYNMRGMGIGSRVLRSRADYAAANQPGYMWMRLLSGAHVSTDVALARGRPVWSRHATGIPAGQGTFDRWILHARHRPALEAGLFAWSRRCLAGFTGIVNFETIGGRIIECHLRMAEQWLDLNGAGWLEAVVGLHRTGRWRFDDSGRRTGYSVVLFGRHGARWSIDRGAVETLRETPGVSSIQITFDPDKPPEQHAMPPGGFRLAIVNCWDLAVGRRVRARLSELFRAAPTR